MPLPRVREMLHSGEPTCIQALKGLPAGRVFFVVNSVTCDGLLDQIIDIIGLR
jgi:hypothetical protein